MGFDIFLQFPQVTSLFFSYFIKWLLVLQCRRNMLTLTGKFFGHIYSAKDIQK